MARRSRDWNEGLARDLRDPKFAREFIIALLDEEFTLQQALGKVIRAYGIKEFAGKTRLPSSNISRAINPKHNPTQRILEQLLRPFGLKLSVAPKSGRRKGKAA